MSIPVIASINCLSVSEWVNFAQDIQEAGSDGLELNIFQLPSDPSKNSEQNEEIYLNIIREVIRRVSIPVAVKISPYFSALANTALKFSWTGIGGLVLFNRYYASDIDLEKFELVTGNVFSSPFEYYLPLRWTADGIPIGSQLVARFGDEATLFRVAAQLVNTRDGYRRWAQSFDRELSDIFAVQDEIAQAVVAALRVKLLPGKAPTTRAVRTANAEVYRLYLLGRDLAKRPTPDEWRRAVAIHEQALALDPGYASAWAGIAFALAKLEGLAGEGTSVARRRRALDAAERAIALDPNLADGYWVRALLRKTFAYDWSGAGADLERARALSPSDAAVVTNSGQLLTTLGRFPEAISTLRRATELDPLSAPAWEQLGEAYTFANEPEAGRAALRRALDAVPRDPRATFILVVNLVAAGRPAEALEVAQGSALEWLQSFGGALALPSLGRAREGQAALQRLIARNAGDSAYQVAEVFAWQRDPDRAFEWLERAYAYRDTGLGFTGGDPLLRPLHQDARWKPFLRRLNLPAE